MNLVGENTHQMAINQFDCSESDLKYPKGFMPLYDKKNPVDKK